MCGHCVGVWESCEKTCKSTLLQILEKGVDPEKQIILKQIETTVLDGIGLVRKKNIEEDMW